MSDDELTITCSCSHLHHVVQFTRVERPSGSGEFEAYVLVSLDYERSLFGRLRTAWRYLTRATCGYGDVSEVIVRQADLPRLRAWVARAEADAAGRRKTPEAPSACGMKER